MLSRFERDVKAIEVLLRTAEQHFHLWDGALRQENQSQPMSSYRAMVCLLAADAGYPYAIIGAALYRDPSTARSGRNKAAERCASEDRWWLENKGTLFDLWEDALGRSD